MKLAPCPLNRLRRSFLTALAVLCLTGGTLWAGGEPTEENGIPLELQVQICLKVMTYDRGAQASATQPFRVGILTRPGGGEDADHQALERIRKTIAGKTLLGRPLEVREVTWPAKGEPDLTESVQILIVPGAMLATMKEVLAFARRNHLMTFGTHPSMVDSGVGMVLSLEGSKPVIHLNLPMIREIGADFHANFLKHCHIIR